MMPLTLGTRIAILHGSNLMDIPCAVPDPLLPCLAAATAPTGTLRQGAATAYSSGRHDHYAFHPRVREMTRVLAPPEEQDHVHTASGS